jgi:proteasome accessory factor B
VADSPTRVERLLNLLAFLLDTRVPRTQAELVREVAGYPDSKEAARRAFERDKEALRGMGVPLRVEPVPLGTPGEVGYRVDPDEYYLPDLGLTPEETAALNVAVHAISVDGGAGHGALMKLGGLTGETAAPIAALPLPPALPTLFEGFRHRAVVTFAYRSEVREVEPWALVARAGRWYLVGFDRGRGAPRTFRADRIEGEVTVGPPGAFTAPDPFDPAPFLRPEPWTWGEGDPVVVELLVDAGHEAGVVDAVGDATVVREDASGTVFAVPVVDREAFRTFVLGFLEHAEVLGPPEVRAEIVAWLEACAA